MIFTHKYIVTSYNGGISGYDNGHWTGHVSKKHAVACANTVNGSAYKVIRKGNNYKLKPVDLDA